MVNPTTRPHRTLKSHPQSRCTPRRCGATGWSPRRCPQRPSSPAPAALPPCGAGSLLGRRQRRGSFKGFGHAEIPKAAVPLMKSSEQDSPYSASKYWTRYGITVMVNDSQDRLGGQVEWELNVCAPPKGYTTVIQPTLQTWIWHRRLQGAGRGTQPRGHHLVGQTRRQQETSNSRAAAAPLVRQLPTLSPGTWWVFHGLWSKLELRRNLTLTNSRKQIAPGIANSGQG